MKQISSEESQAWPKALDYSHSRYLQATGHGIALVGIGYLYHDPKEEGSVIHLISQTLDSIASGFDTPGTSSFTVQISD